jgi:hypothetical protein
MWWGVVCAAIATIAYGLGSVLQASAARTTANGNAGTGPGGLVRTMRQWRYVAGLGLDFLGFLAQLVALRVLPLFVVQAVLAASLAVTALGSLALGVTLGRREWASVLLVCVGLAMLGSSAEAEGATPVGAGFHIALPLVSVLLGAVGLAAARVGRRVGASLLGLVAGWSFGVVAIAARVTDTSSATAVLEDPATCAVVLAGGCALACCAASLQRGAVTTVTAMMVLGETLLPAAVGVLLLGDTTRPGYGVLGVAGFVLAVLATTSLARFGEIETPAAASEPSA